MPEFPIVDAHVHFWDPAGGKYPWLAGVPPLSVRRTPAELDAARGSVELAKIVFVQCGRTNPFEEVEWVADFARTDPRIRGIVAHAPLENGDAVAADLRRLATQPLVKGVRRLLQDEPDDAFCLRPGFVRGVQLLPSFGFSCDLCIYHRQLGAVTELVRRCPEVNFILDHGGKPGIKTGLAEPWRTQLRELAALPNVVCKLSGLATEADHAAWTPAQLQPYLEHILSCFGPERTMFGSDWPVSTLAIRYPQWAELVDAVLAGVPESQRRQIYVATAERVYRI